jgi:hypothetical protein
MRGKQLQRCDAGDDTLLVMIREEDQMLIRSACILLAGLLAGLTYALVGKI